ncbi:P-loop containing nucleoside triphosphate hydrolase protein [Gaertneriomyces semiglobifer]|nr:P-loop containing nucleoside triphosphate hydrolase protein [Gaertneriomyces semiglobifer]
MGARMKLSGPFDPLSVPTLDDDDEVPLLDAEEDDVQADIAPPSSSQEKKRHDEQTNSGVTDANDSPKLSRKQQKAAKKAAERERQMQIKAASSKAIAKKSDITTPDNNDSTSGVTTVIGGKKKGKHVEPDDVELNPEFTFEADGGLNLVGPEHPWDFTEVKKAIRAQMKDTVSTSIDEKIAARRRRDDRGKESGANSNVDSDDEDVVSGDETEDAKSESDHSGDEFDKMDVEDDTENEDDDAVVTAQEKPQSRNFSKPESDSEEDPEDIVQQKRKAEYFAPAPEPIEFGDDTFTTMRLSRPILKGIATMGFVKPTAIQSRAIPIALQGTDICGSAVTGSGKTAAFIIPTIERLLFRPRNVAQTRVLILVPTRELGVQCHSVATNLAKFTDIQFCLCVGGLNTKIQEVELRKRPDVVIATPGRLIDHIHNSRSFNLDSIEILIMDEADRMLEDGFAAELNEIITHTPKTRQTMLFSATMTDNVDDLIKLSLNRPVRLFVDNATSLASRLVQEFIRVRSHKEEARPAILASLCTRTYKTKTIVFFRSKAAAHHMKIVFGLLGLKAAELHGNLTQLQRLEALEAFRDHKVDFLLATDLASRGLDIAGIQVVINYDMPRNYAQYVHRIGRTARGGAGGRAVSLIGEADRTVLKLAVKNSRDEVKHRVVPATVVAKFEAKIAALADTIKELYAEEKEEKEMRKAEMEVTKATNMIEHEDEIKSRPARTWFLNEKEKQDQKELGRVKHNTDFGIVDDKGKKGKAGSETCSDFYLRTTLYCHYF